MMQRNVGHAGGPPTQNTRGQYGNQAMINTQAAAVASGHSGQPMGGASTTNGNPAGGSTVFSIDTKHEDNINDCQFDYYGTQVASCDSKGFL